MKNSKDYLVSLQKDINGLIITEGDVIKADGYGVNFISDMESIHCVEFKDDVFGSDIYSDFEPLSTYKTIEILAHCEDFRKEWEMESVSGNIGAVIKAKRPREYYKLFTLKNEKTKNEDYHISQEQLEKIEHFKRMFSLNADLIGELCNSEGADIVYGFELGKIYAHLKECFTDMMQLEDEIRNQEIFWDKDIRTKTFAMEANKIKN